MTTKNTPRVSFTILEKQMTQMLRIKAKITPNKTTTKTAKSGLFYKSEQIAIQQSHIINPLLTSFARSVRESIAYGFYRTVQKTSGNTFLYRPRTQLITPYAFRRFTRNFQLRLIIFYEVRHDLTLTLKTH